MKPLNFLIILIFLIFSPAHQSSAQAEVVTVIIALQDLPRGFHLTEEMVGGENAAVGIAFYPVNAVPAGAIQRLEDVIGKVVRTDIPREMPMADFYLAPDIRQDATASLPYPVSPSGYQVIRDRNTLSYDQPEKLRFSPGLAAGDEVSIVASTGINDIVRDETYVLIERAVIASLTPDEIVFSITQEETTLLNEFLSTGFQVTLIAFTPLDTTVAAFTEIIQWEYLSTRIVNPMILPDGTDILNVESVQP